MSKLITTKIGLKKLCKAHAGAITLPPITKMVWGSGGLDEGGDPKNVTGDETGLSALLLEKEIDGYDFVRNLLLLPCNDTGGGTGRRGDLGGGACGF